MTFLLALLLFPIFIIVCIVASIQQKRQERDRKEAANRRERERKETLYRQEQERKNRIQMEQQVKQEQIIHFHSFAFPVHSSVADICSRWNYWPSSIHDKDDKIERQKRALYNTLPISINTKDFSGHFVTSALITSDEYDVLIYETTLSSCTCPDFKRRGGPCKHIYRLFYELTHIPYENPGIIDIDSEILSRIFNLSPTAQQNFIHNVISYRIASHCVKITTIINEQISAGLLVTNNAIPYEALLDDMTKDQILLALTKKNVHGYYPSWPKYKLVAWILETQPSFLKKQFRNHTLISFSPELDEWISGVRLSCHSFHLYISDSEFSNRYYPYGNPST